MPTDPHQPPLPLEDAPVVLRQHGLADAHTAPLCGVRLRDDSIRCVGRRAPAEAWRDYPLLEWLRTGNSIAALGFDVDDREGLEALAAASMGGSAVPTPNLAAYRSESGHALAVYTLRRPVHRGADARPGPLAMLARASEWLRAELHADTGFLGVLASNPAHPHYSTAWLRMSAYSLADLCGNIPRGWRTPTTPTTEAGRNNWLFRALCRFAGGPGLWLPEVAVRAEADRLAERLDREAPHLFGAPEFGGVIASVLRYRERWRSGGVSARFRGRQAAKGRKGGLASKGGGRPKVYATAAERQRAYRQRRSVTKQAYTDSTAPGPSEHPSEAVRESSWASAVTPTRAGGAGGAHERPRVRSAVRSSLEGSEASRRRLQREGGPPEGGPAAKRAAVRPELSPEGRAQLCLLEGTERRTARRRRRGGRGGCGGRNPRRTPATARVAAEPAGGQHAPGDGVAWRPAGRPDARRRDVRPLRKTGRTATGEPCGCRPLRMGLGPPGSMPAADLERAKAFMERLRKRAAATAEEGA